MHGHMRPVRASSSTQHRPSSSSDPSSSATALSTTPTSRSPHAASRSVSTTSAVTSAPGNGFDWSNLAAPMASFGPVRPAPAIPVNIFAGPPSTAPSPSTSTSNRAAAASMRSHWSPSASFQHHQQHQRGGHGSKEPEAVVSPLGVKGLDHEWTYFGADFAVIDLSHYTNEALSARPMSPASETGPSASSSKRPLSVAGRYDVFSASFGDSKWQVELYNRSTERPQNMSLSIVCNMIDTTLSTVTVPCTVMYGFREAGQAAANKLASSRWLYQRWVRNFTFSALRDSIDDVQCPSIESLLAHDGVRARDSLVLTVQIQTVAPTVQPLVESARLVPSALLAGIRGLLDNHATGDVAITTFEYRQPHKEAASQVSNDEESAFFRKRVLYAHSAILKARSSYFQDMLGSDAIWAETAASSSSSSNKAMKKASIRMEDFGFETVYWFLHYLYTDDITFDQVEDVRKHSTESLPSGWTSVADELTWDEFDANDVAAKMQDSLADRHRRHASARSTTSADGDATSVSSSMSGSRSRSSFSAPPLSTSPTSTAGRTSRMTSSVSAFGRTTTKLSGSKTVQAPRPPPSLSSLLSPSPQPVPAGLLDPHPHPAPQPGPASPLAMYQIAHRYSITTLAELALEHIVLNLTPRTAFPLLLATPLWPDLHSSIKTYALQHFGAISAEPEMARCYAEVAEGMWPNGGEVLLDFTLSAVRDLRSS